MMRNYLLLFFSIIFLFQNNNLISQNISPDKMVQIRSFLDGKGIDENLLIERLKSKGIDVVNMSESELLMNQSVIKETVDEMESLNQEVDQEINNNNFSGNNDQNLMSIADVKSPKLLAEDININNNLSEINDENETERYGIKIFRDNSMISYNISKDASPPDSYILGPGDKINVLIFGASQVELFYEINPDGFIKPTSMPKIFISGLTLKKAKKLLIARFSKYYNFNNDQFALTLNTSRTITVNIFGEVVKVGSYTSSALNSVLNILTEAGGPTDFGSVRNIQIIRGNKKRILDVYDFMNDPGSEFEFSLSDNDIIYVPPVKKVISIEGEVSRPMNYELKDDEGIKQLLDYAGGLTTEAYTGLIQISSYENNKPVLNDYYLEDVISGKVPLRLKNGDKINIKTITETFKDFVSISGAVNYEGIYPINSTPYLNDLLKKSKIKTDAKTELIFIIRKNTDKSDQIISLNLDKITLKDSSNFKLKAEDQVIIFDQEKYTDKFNISVLGEVRDPYTRTVSYDNIITIKEALNLAGGLTKDAANFGFIYRNPPFDSGSTEYIKINFPEDLNKNLMPGDELVSFNKNDYNLDSSIQIVGDVKNPVQIRYDKSLTIKDLFLIARGPNISANLQDVDVIRIVFNKSTKPTQQTISLKIDEEFNILNNDEFSLKPFDIVSVRSITNFNIQEYVYVSGQLNKIGAHGISDNNRFSDIINRAGGLTDFADLRNSSIIRDNNIIVFDAVKAISRKNSVNDPILKPGDLINIPKLDNIVSINTSNTNYILGENQDQLNVVYSKNKSALWYINKYSSGLTKEASKKSITTSSSNGLVSRTSKGFLFLNKYPKVKPGDIINIGAKPIKEKEDKEKKPFDWDSFTTKLISIGTFYLLTKSITE